jgi:transcriptional regulator with XRE-family HTH domain
VRESIQEVKLFGGGAVAAMQSFGKEFKRIRRVRKVTLREIGEYVGKSIGYLSDIEHDRKGPPDLRIVEKIEQFLGVKDNSLINLAARIRSQRPENLAQRIKRRPILSEVLLRADEFSDEELQAMINDIEKKGRGK